MGTLRDLFCAGLELNSKILAWGSLNAGSETPRGSWDLRGLPVLHQPHLCPPPPLPGAGICLYLLSALRWDVCHRWERDVGEPGEKAGDPSFEWRLLS